MRNSRVVFTSKQSGQSLVETVLAMPVLLLLVFNGINFAYFFLMTLNLSVAPRAGVEYSMLGGETPGTNGLATATGAANTTASYITYQDMTGAISSPGNARIQVCSKALGFSGGTAQCSVCTSSTGTCTGAGPGSPAPDADPEPTKFVLQRVDVTYTFTPLLPPALFNLTILAIPSCTSSGGNVSCVFHRQVSMRAMD
jgi:hypothetical protein